MRFASWGSFGGELPGLDDPCMAAAARAMSSKLVVARPLYDTVRVLVRSLGHVSAVTAMALQPPSPPTFQEALKNDRAQFEDCTPCRIVGTALPRRYELPDPVLIHTQEAQRSLAYVSGHSQIKANEAAIRASKSMFGMRSRGIAITGTSAVMVGLGVYRWFS